MFGKSVTDLQENIVVGGNSISGTLKYIADYSSAGYTGDEESGNFLVLHFESAEADTIVVELLGGVHGPITLDPDGICIFRIANKSQKIKVTLYKDNESIGFCIYSLTGLTLRGE